MTTVLNGALTCDGWTSWADVRELLGDDVCLWVDLRGPHRGPAPADRPVGTHLWAWRPDRWVRVRIDGERVLATVFTENASAGERATAALAEGIPWGDDLRAAKWEHPVTLLVTEGPAPLTFARVRPPSGAGEG